MTLFDSLWADLEPIGRDGRSGGYRRFAYDDAELACREWFIGQAQSQGLDVERDRNGNLWSWWIPSGVDAMGQALVVGSHLDSVPDGGAFDGPLGIVSSFAAIDVLQRSGFTPTRPLAVAAFADEEGARFGIACAGSRLMTGQLDPDKARSLRGRDGMTMAEAMTLHGMDAREVGRDDERLARIGAFVELHVEQGIALVDESATVGVANSIWPHGRYRFTFEGKADHAGTTRMQDRHDPMVAYAHAALAAQDVARRLESRATFGRLEVEPNGTNAIPSRVNAWLDARAATQESVDEIVAEVFEMAKRASRDNGTSVVWEAESVTGILEFDAFLRDRVAAVVAAHQGRESVPILPTGAGHDAGILSGAGIPSAMLFVRNPTGVSHSPHEYAERDDCVAGVDALAAVIQDLA